MPPPTRSTAKKKTADGGVLRCVYSGPLAPALNMGIDEALLRDTGPPTLRLYGWSPPGLSLGYFQSSADFADVGGPHVLVRRLTGGGAIYHDREVTFALTADLDLLPASVPDSYALVHRAIHVALSARGIAAEFSTAVGAGARPRPREPWCLAEPGPHDLVDGAGRKVLGSAQRRIGAPRPRILHHGSLVLVAPHATPDCGAVGEPADVGELCSEVAAQVAAALGLRAVEGTLTDTERERGQQLAVRRYQADAFTHRR